MRLAPSRISVLRTSTPLSCSPAGAIALPQNSTFAWPPPNEDSDVRRRAADALRQLGFRQ
jgi:hypothetical protein